MLTILIEREFLKRFSIDAKFVDSGAPEKVTFPQVSSFSVSVLYIFVVSL